jgi:hypothetical protein
MLEHFKGKGLLYFLPVLMLELATANNVFGNYHFYEDAGPALLLAVSFSLLLVGTAMMASHDLGGGIRALLVCGGILSFLLQAWSNISLGYVHAIADPQFPAGPLADLWGYTSSVAYTKDSAKLSGLGINIVGAIYWVAISLYFSKQRSEEGKREQERLETLRQMWNAHPEEAHAQ